MNTTIAVSTKVRDELQEFGNMGETYDDVIKRLLKSAKDRMLHDLMFNDNLYVSVDDALKRAEKKYGKS